MLDITLNSAESISAFLGVFCEKCGELAPRNCNKLNYRSLSISVFKDEDYADMFDVIVLRDGVGSEDTDFGGVHSHELNELIERILFHKENIT